MNFHGGYFGKEGLIDFSVNIPPLAFDDDFKAMLSSNVDELMKYPELSGKDTILEMAKLLGFDPSMLILGNGATELIYLFARTVPIQKAMILEPTFTEYRRALETHHVQICDFDLDLVHPEVLNVEAVVRAIDDEGADLLVLCNPNNPTGHLYRVEDLDYILTHVKHPNFKLFIDESFIDFVSIEYQDAYYKAMQAMVQKYPIFLLRSMTKTYSVPGLRIGYGVGHSTLIDKMYQYKEPWSLNTFALLSIPYFLKKTAHALRVNAWSSTENAYMAQTLNAIEGIRLIAGEANYHLIELTDLDGDAFFECMKAEGYYLRTCMDFKGLGKQYFRIALREREENRLFLEALKKVLMEATR